MLLKTYDSWTHSIIEIITCDLFFLFLNQKKQTFWIPIAIGPIKWLISFDRPRLRV